MTRSKRKSDKTYKFREEHFGPYLTHSDGAPVFKVGPYVTFTDVWIQLHDEESVLLETDKIRGKNCCYDIDGSKQKTKSINEAARQSYSIQEKHQSNDL